MLFLKIRLVLTHAPNVYATFDLVRSIAYIIDPMAEA